MLYKSVEQHVCIMCRVMNTHEVSLTVICNIKEERKYVDEFTYVYGYVIRLHCS